ncbi:MAG: hypothetical protein M1389_04240 [Chloroflexi bacterium]|nr:hypothetical protein [Chloroflexota bacterium]
MAEGSDIPRRQLGRTGEMVSASGLGGFHVGKMQDEQESIRLVCRALDNGINFLDNSWDYHKMLDVAFAHGFVFDTVQMPLNLMDAHYDSFEKKVLPVLNEHNIGVRAMKPLGDHTIIQNGLAEPAGQDDRQ